MEVSQALAHARKLAEDSPSGRVSIPTYVSGMAARGSTVARNVLSTKQRNLADQIKKDRDSLNPLWIKNHYMSPFYLFGWSELAQDMEAQNFFLADPEKNDVENTIKVYPSLKSMTDFERKFRDCQPAAYGKTEMNQGFFSSVQFWGCQYFRLWEVLYEGDKLTLFGVLTYDKNTKQASIDETVAMMAADTSEKLKEMLNWELMKCYGELVAQCFGLLAVGLGLWIAGVGLTDRMRVLRLKADAAALANQDAQN